MLTTDEEMFAGISKRGDIETVIDSLIVRCTNLPKDLKPDMLYSGDRVFLMMNIRAASYGANYGFKATCPECQARWDHSMDMLADLEVQEVPEDHQDPFDLELPQNGDTVSLRIARGYDERAIIKYIDRQNKKVDIRKVGDPGYTYRLSLHLMGVTSSTDPNLSFSADNLAERPGVFHSMAIRYIEALTAMDSSAIRQEIDNRTPGISTAIDLECPKCNHEWRLGLPLTADFFRSKPASGVHTGTRVVSRVPREAHTR